MLTLLSAALVASNALAMPAPQAHPALAYARATHTATSELFVSQTESWSTGAPLPCQWTQTFEDGVLFEYASPECHDRSHWLLTLPKIPLDEVKALVEAIDQASDETPTSGEEAWRTAGSYQVYADPKGLSGCSYTVEITDDQVLVEFGCAGC